MSHPSCCLFRMLLPRVCVVCRSIDRSGLCPSCRGGLVPVSGQPAVPALFAYVGVGRDVVTALKYRDARRVVGALADGLVALVPSGVPCDAVVGVPTSPARRRARGFDQAELLARAVAVRLGVPARRLLVRVGTGAAQTGRSRVERLDGPSFAVVGPPVRRVLLVDDVVTTGATVAAARAALSASGVARVDAVVVAATPEENLSFNGRSTPLSGSHARRR